MILFIFYKESYNEFKGDNYKYTYKPSMSEDLKGFI